jgi:hypothetical protein
MRRWLSFNGLSLVRLLLLALVTYSFAYALFVGVKLYSHYRYDRQVIPSAWEWEVVEDKKGYPVLFRYDYSYGGKSYSGSSVLAEVSFPSSAAARSYAQSQPKSVYISSKKPFYASIDRVFPWKNLFYLAMLVGVSGYFTRLYKRGIHE